METASKLMVTLCMTATMSCMGHGCHIRCQTNHFGMCLEVKIQGKPATINSTCGCQNDSLFELFSSPFELYFSPFEVHFRVGR